MEYYLFPNGRLDWNIGQYMLEKYFLSLIHVGDYEYVSTCISLSVHSKCTLHISVFVSF